MPRPRYRRRSTSGASTSRARGPCTAMTDHCSVVEVSQARSSRPLGLQVVLHQREDARRAAGRRRHVEAIVGHAGDHAVVVDEAVVAQQDAVARAPRRARLAKSLTYMRDRNVAASGPTTSILPSVEASNMPTARAHGAAFARHRRVHVFAGSREVARALPLADVLEHRAVPLAPTRAIGVRAHRVEQVAAVVAGEECRTSRACRACGTSSARLSAADVPSLRQRSPAHSGSTSCPGRSPCRSSCSA